MQITTQKDPKRTTATPFWMWVPRQPNTFGINFNNKRSRNTPTKKRLGSKCWNLSANMGRMGMGFLDYASPSYLFCCRAMINVFWATCHCLLAIFTCWRLRIMISPRWFQPFLDESVPICSRLGLRRLQEDHVWCIKSVAVLLHLALLLKGATFWNCIRGYQSSGLAKVNINNRMRACKKMRLDGENKILPNPFSFPRITDLEHTQSTCLQYQHHIMISESVTVNVAKNTVFSRFPFCCNRHGKAVLDSVHNWKSSIPGLPDFKFKVFSNHVPSWRLVQYLRLPAAA